MLVLPSLCSSQISPTKSISSFTLPLPKQTQIPSQKKTLPLSLANKAKADGRCLCNQTTPSTNNTAASPSPSFHNNDAVFVGQEDVSFEGVIQFEKGTSSSSRLVKWGRVALLAGGDVLALLLFSAIGRINHGFHVFYFDTLRTADPFMAGWVLGAYLLGVMGTMVLL